MSLVLIKGNFTRWTEIDPVLVITGLQRHGGSDEVDLLLQPASLTRNYRSHLSWDIKKRNLFPAAITQSDESKPLQVDHIHHSEEICWVLASLSLNLRCLQGREHCLVALGLLGVFSKQWTSDN